MKALAVIPCRRKSERLEDKNFRQVGGVSLVQHAVTIALAARQLGLVDEVVVSYDDWHQGLTVLDQPVRLHHRGIECREQSTTTIQVVQELLKKTFEGNSGCTNGCMRHIHGQEWGLVCLLLPTSPLRTLRHLVQSRLLVDEECTAVMSVVPFRQNPMYTLTENGGGLRLTRDRDRHLPPVGRELSHDGTVIWAKSGWVRNATNWYDSTSIRAYHVDPLDSVDINDSIDLRIANSLYDRRQETPA